jgi:hypothetical protein
LCVCWVFMIIGSDFLPGLVLEVHAEELTWNQVSWEGREILVLT